MKKWPTRQPEDGRRKKDYELIRIREYATTAAKRIATATAALTQVFLL
jgi:hypothetical protein